jgi:hypothetical protein
MPAFISSTIGSVSEIIPVVGCIAITISIGIALESSAAADESS